MSYDPTRELYDDYNAAFAKYWKAKTGQDVTVQQSNGGSGKQARAVIDGLAGRRRHAGPRLRHRRDRRKGEAAASELADALAEQQHAVHVHDRVSRAPAAIPKHIHDWDDLVKPGVAVITPNPKTSGGARWNFLAAWAYAIAQPGGNAAKAKAFVTHLYKNVPVLDSGARGSTTTFVERGIGDVRIAWENDALLAVEQAWAGQVPNRRAVAEHPGRPPVALVDKVVDKKGTRAVAQAYLEYLYTPEGQDDHRAALLPAATASVAKRYADSSRR